MDTDGVIQLFALLILVCLSAFFSSAETALSTVNKVKLKALADEGNKRAKTALEVLDKYGKMLSAILIGNNIVNLYASSLATTLALSISLPVGIATGILTVVILIFGEITPKNMAMCYSEKLALFYASTIAALMKILTPVIYVVDKLASGILKLLHIDINKRTAMTENELRTYVEVSHEDGVIESEEREIIYNAMSYNPMTQVMSGNWKFETYNEQGEVIGERIRPVKMRQTYKQEMKYLAELCGFEVVEIYGDYFKNTKDTGRYVWILRKK